MNTSYVLYLGIIPYLAEGDIGTNCAGTTENIFGPP